MVTEEPHHQRWLAAIEKLVQLHWVRVPNKNRVKRVLAKHGIETSDYKVDLTIDLAKAAFLLDEYGFGVSLNE